MFQLEIVFYVDSTKTETKTMTLHSKHECKTIMEILTRSQSRMMYKSFKISQITKKYEKPIYSWDNEKFHWINYSEYRTYTLCDKHNKK